MERELQSDTCKMMCCPLASHFEQMPYWYLCRLHLATVWKHNVIHKIKRTYTVS